MPRIFDNIDRPLLPALQDTLKLSSRADFCVGYLNLRGWRFIDSLMDSWKGAPDECCRLLIGMQRPDSDELRDLLSVHKKQTGMDQQTAKRFGRQLAEDFRKQLLWGAPTNEDEAGLRRLVRQLREKKIMVKLFLRHSLHAKLYLLFRKDPISPTVGYLGSSNLTMPGLSEQGELNIDVLDSDATAKLAGWFDDRWNDRFNIDISEDLINIIDNSWAQERLIPPYYLYIKMAYHLSQEARAGLSEFKIPLDLASKLFEFQIAAVKIAAHHLMHRHGVLLGDVVGLGKTLMATAVARVLQEDGFETLIICPPNLVSMWESYRDTYRLFARTVSMGQVEKILPELKPFRLVIIDESHNLRNREGKRYKAIKDYISTRNSRCILLTATPYNKSFLDLSNQLRLFVPDDHDIGIRPEALLRRMTETEFIRQHQCPVRSLAAFEKSEFVDDWRELMRLYLVRRTRTFIQQNYTFAQCACGSTYKGFPDTCAACGKPLSGKERRFLRMQDGTPTYFPDRLPRTVRFSLDEKNSTDQYARLYSRRVVDSINGLFLPRYGLGNYLIATPTMPPTQAEAHQMQDLSRAGKRLMGFCRTNLFKRLESSGPAFLLSVSRHILRNFVYLHALENHKPIPLGTQDAVLLDDRVYDEDSETVADLFGEPGVITPEVPVFSIPITEKEYRERAAEVYDLYAGEFHSRFSWLRPDLFVDDLGTQLHHDARSLLGILALSNNWKHENDAKLNFLYELVAEKHPTEKVIVFSQFSDTIRYLATHLKKLGVDRLEAVTGDTPDPTAVAWRFSPRSNDKKNAGDRELRILLATDVLSEGQNLQDCAIVVNFDLPWAIIRLIQRAGRVDRIGQQAQTIPCYTVLPADGVERIIQLRARIRQRLKENSEVVGTDEAFFEDDNSIERIADLYNEKAGILDGDGEGEVDLASYAYQIWKNATDAQPELRRKIEQMQDVAFATRRHTPTIARPEGVLLYAKTGEGNDALAYVDKQGVNITESQFEILKIAACAPDCPAQPRNEEHHRLVAAGVEHIMKEEKRIGGQLGRPTGARFRCYERMKNYAASIKGTMFETPELLKAIDEIYRYPLRPAATDKINRQLRNGIQDMQLADLILSMREEERLCIIEESEQTQEPRIICSMGMFESMNRENGD